MQFCIADDGALEAEETLMLVLDVEIEELAVPLTLAALDASVDALAAEEDVVLCAETPVTASIAVIAPALRREARFFIGRGDEKIQAAFRCQRGDFTSGVSEEALPLS
ncbi:hypothetical protein HY285_01670 [Candidatus Peregrinibacteria bacterium]|nr:hypothetical protein [Candidatus Peregrinibacteria bacterium]MBI3816236.1 hypothetical protein [Candidatus Peregrinibacteria bacterium]